MENILKTYYAVFEDFQYYFYWSSAPAKRKQVWWYIESTEYARATKAYIKDNGDFDYRPSDSGNEFTNHNGTGGYAKRTEALRIRAAYKPK